MRCICESGWLPIDGERDSIIEDERELLLLFPTVWTQCWLCWPCWPILLEFWHNGESPYAGIIAEEIKI